MEENNTNREFFYRVHFTVCDETIDETVIISEEIYRTIMRPGWKEKRQAERESRCMETTKTGRIRRCRKDCSKCDKFRSGTPFSLEQMQEAGMDATDYDADVEEAIMYSELLKALMDILDNLDPDKRAICQAIMDDKDDRAAAADLGYVQSTYNYKKRKLLADLKNRLSKYR